MIVASIQARLGSKRLPGKALADICGAPALTRLLRRLRRAKTLDDIILATPDEKLADWAFDEKLPAFVGSEDDVLDRLVGAHRWMKTDIVVQVWGDSPLIDPEVVDIAVETFKMNLPDVVTNTRKPGFPEGVGVSVFRREKLEEIARLTTTPTYREHAGLYFYDHPYRVIHLAPPPCWHRPDVRLLLDYPEDLEFIRQLYKRAWFWYGDDFGLDKILRVINDFPELLAINRMHAK